MIRPTLIAVLAAVVSQQPPAPPPPAAKPFALSVALEAAQAALASCQSAGAPAVVEVMDTAFNPKVILAADGSRPNRIEFARKSYSYWTGVVRSSLHERPNSPSPSAKRSPSIGSPRR